MNKDYYNNWYQIEEFPNGPYEINKMGQIRNKRTKNILKPQIKNAGYLVYTLYIDKFKPEYISKMDFYLEALDRQKKKENENPSVGMILCASKDDEVVEYAMSRTLSPMMVAEYKLQLPDKAVLQKKLQELINMPLIEE